MRLGDEVRAVAGVARDDLAGVGVEAVEEHAHEAPDAAGEVNFAVGDDGPPRTAHVSIIPGVAQDRRVRRGGFESPEQPAGGDVERVEVAVVGADEETALFVGGGRQRTGPCVKYRHRSLPSTRS